MDEAVEIVQNRHDENMTEALIVDVAGFQRPGCRQK